MYKPANEEEREFLKSYDPSKFPITVVTVDLVVFSWVVAGRTDVLLIRRGNYPFKGYWALPGGFIDPNETGEEAALRELHEEAGIKRIREGIKFVRAADTPDRDPRGRAISLVYTARTTDRPKPFPGDDAVEAKWWPLKQALGLDLAFDHSKLLRQAWTVV